MQHLFGTDLITVEARTFDGLLANEASFSISPVQPILTLYQNHPLFGMMYHQALSSTTFIPDSEMTFAAVPYFAQTRSVEDPSLTFEWRVNGKKIPVSETDPGAITINADNSSGIAILGLELTHATNYYLDARGLWNITFSTNASAQDLFRNFNQ